MSQASKQSGPRENAQQKDQTIPAARSREKVLERVKKGIEQATDVRQKRVEAAKRVLKEGKLNLKGKDLAAKIFADLLSQERMIYSLKSTKPSTVPAGVCE